MYFTLKTFSRKWEQNIRILIKLCLLILFKMSIKLPVILLIINNETNKQEQNTRLNPKNNICMEKPSKQNRD